MYGVNTHEPLRRIQHQGDFSPLPRELVSETTPCIVPSSENKNFLPLNFVSLPSVEEGHVTLRQQTSLRSAMTSEEKPSGVKNWHHKAIRRNLSKAKELVLFVGGLKCNLPSAQYVLYATECTKTEKKSASVGPVFPSLGCFFVTFLSGTSASLARKRFRYTRFFGRIPDLLFLPYISVPQNTEEYTYDPLLVFINCKSGGGQGNQLYESLVETLNRSQVFLIDKNGAIPGLYAFRKLSKFRVLVCGGDGTVGWVLSHLDKVQRHLSCPDPPIAVLPVGTGNDLARVLGYGSGWGGENVNLILAQIHDSEPVGMDRWNVMFDSYVTEDKFASADPLLLSDAVSFRNDKGDEKPVSPINIVMSLGGFKSQSGKHSALHHGDGVRNLVSAVAPLVLPPENSTSDDIFSYDKIMSKNNNHCDSTNVLQRNLIEGLATSDVNVSRMVDDNSNISTLPDNALHKLTIESYSRTADESNKDCFPTDEAVSTVKSTVDIMASDETLHGSLNRNKQSKGDSTLTNLSDSMKGSNAGRVDMRRDNLVQADSIPSNSATIEKVATGLISSDGESLKDSTAVVATAEYDFEINDTVQNRPVDCKQTQDTLASRETSLHNLAPDETEYHSSSPEATTSSSSDAHLSPPLQRNRSYHVSSLESQISDENSPSLLRPRSRSSSRHRLVQILSASDLEFGPFVSYEEKNTEESEETGEQLKRKASLLKLIDTNDSKLTEQDSLSADLEKLPDNLTSVDSTFEDGVFEQHTTVSNVAVEHPRLHPTSIQRFASETTAVKQEYKPVECNKKFSLPASRNFSDLNNEVQSDFDTGVKLIVMNNYFGIGIDAELNLAFHLAREENPEKCTSRLRNKALYFKAGLKKMTSRSVNLNNVIELEVNNKVISLPSIRGLIFLNISSWAAGAKPWGSGVSKRFDSPSFGDGMLEIIGVGGVAHMSQIYSGLRTGTRIAQGEYIKMTIKAEVAVQIDGEPWMQPPGNIIISASPHQAIMLKKNKKKSK